jgi:hypothetical protein
MLNKEDTEPIVNWAINNLQFIKERKDKRGRNIGSPNGHSGNIFGIQNIDSKDTQEELKSQNFPIENLVKIDSKLKDLYNIPEDVKTAKMGWILMYGEDGYICRPHTDRNKEDMIHTRLNVMISKPEEGGQAIISNQIIEREENEPWICVAGVYEHSTVEVKGKKPRIMLSLGYMVNKETLIENSYI